MATTQTKTIRETIKAAARVGGLIDVREDFGPEEYAVGITVLNDMLKAWQNVPYKLWTKTSGTLATGDLAINTASFTMDPVRPMELLNVRLKRSSDGIETPMHEMTREEYDNLPDKLSAGCPTGYYYDRQREAAKIFIWPVFKSLTTESIVYTYERELEDVTALTETLDCPGETYLAVQYNLAIFLCHNMNAPVPDQVASAAGGLLDDAEAFDAENFYEFGWGDQYHQTYG